MSKIITVEVVAVGSDIAILSLENGTEFELDLQYLPENIKIGNILRFNISHMVLSHRELDK